MNLKIDTNSEKKLLEFYTKDGLIEVVHCYTGERGLFIIHTLDAGKHHISISTNNRQPSWKEIKEVKYQLLPDLEMAVILPPECEYVNIHEYCFHIYQL
jgi:hypothetical protein